MTQKIWSENRDLWSENQMLIQSKAKPDRDRHGANDWRAVKDGDYKAETWASQRAGRTSKEAFLAHSCLQSVCPLGAAEKNVPWAHAESSLLFFPLLRSAITEHRSEFCGGLALRGLSLCDYHKGNSWKTSLSLNTSYCEKSSSCAPCEKKNTQFLK